MCSNKKFWQKSIQHGKRQGKVKRQKVRAEKLSPILRKEGFYYDE